MQCAFSFGLSASGHFLATAEIFSGLHPWLSIAAFPDENAFIELCVAEIKNPDAIKDLLAHVLLAAAGRITGDKWTRLEISEEELRGLGILNPLLSHDGHGDHDGRPSHDGKPGRKRFP